MRFSQGYDEEWIEPIQPGYKICCCDCGLVHDIEFRIVNGKVQIKANRNNKATSSRRRNKKHRRQKLYLNP